jgi:hypothetical protein
MTTDLTNKLIWGLANRALPAPNSGDNTYGPVRTSRYGELITQGLAGSKMHALAGEGSYFIATNPTPGTAIAGIAAADGLDDLEALVFLRNGASNDKQIHLDFILLQAAAAGTNGTNFAFAMKGDKGNSRYASGGSSITPVNTNMASSRTSGIDRLQFGAVVPTAATSEARLLHHGLLRTVIKVIGDKYLFKFGDASPGVLSGIPLEGTTQANINVPCPPVVLDPGDTFLLHEFAASQSAAAQYQFAIGFWVR